MLAFHLLTTIWTLSMIVVQVVAVELTDLIPLIPQCALPCVISGLTPASISDPELTCQNVTLQASVSACVQRKCNHAQQIQLSQVNKKLCEGVPIDQSRVWLQANIMFIFFPIAILAVAIRIYSRLIVSRWLGWDDWLILLSGVTLIALLVLNLMNILGNGFGRHYWNIDTTKVVILLKTFYVAEILYLLTVTLVKASYLMFYLRIFPSRIFKIADLTILVLVIANGIGAIIAAIAQCRPINAVWDQDLKPAKCININVLAYAQGAIAVAFDITILILPIPELVRLNMSFWKKLQVLFMFSLGSVACITSIIRLQYLVHFATSTDITWDNALPSMWSVIEIHIAVICACLPAARQLFSVCLPSMFSVSATSNYAQNPKDSLKSSGIRLQSLDESMLSSPKKPVINSSNQGFLSHISNAEGTTFTEVWADRKRGNNNDPAPDQEHGITSLDYETSESSMYALEGPRKSDEEAIICSEAKDAQPGYTARNILGFVHVEKRTTQTVLVPDESKKSLPVLRRDHSLKWSP